MWKKLVFFVILCLIIVSGYFGIACYYSTGFIFGTWINGIYCTGKSIEEVNQELLRKYHYEGCQISFADQKNEVFTEDKTQIKADFTKELTKIQNKQNAFYWYKNVADWFTDPQLSEIEPEIAVDETAFRKWFYALPEVTVLQNEKHEITITRTEQDGYLLHDTKWNVLHADLAFRKSLEAVRGGQKEISLLKEGCYQDIQPTEEEKKILAEYDRLNKFLNFQLIYDMGDSKVTYSHAKLSGLITTGAGDTDFVLDDKGDFTWNEDREKDLIAALAQEYDTYQSTRSFHTTRGDTVSITGGTYGSQIDQKKELVFLKSALDAHKTQTHIPAYLRQAEIRGKNDIGKTYIEIDLTNQKLYGYIDGKKIADTPIVTGNMMLHRETPPGVYFIYAKQRNRTLRGPGYAAHVNYWMPVKNGIGIHDALWRTEFGGTIYQREGSHGCINTPLDAMKKLYADCKVGMPVVMYQ